MARQAQGMEAVSDRGWAVQTGGGEPDCPFVHPFAGYAVVQTQLAQQLQAAVEKGKLQDASTLLNKLKVSEVHQQGRMDGPYTSGRGGRGGGGSVIWRETPLIGSMGLLVSCLPAYAFPGSIDAIRVPPSPSCQHTKCPAGAAAWT